MRRTAALILLGLLGVLVAPLAEAHAETEPVTWSIAPATADGPDDRVSLRMELEPGEDHRDHLAVTNHSEREVTFALTASDGVVDENGNFGLLSGREPSGSGTWIEIPQTVTVAAGQSAVVPVTISVPADALPGDHPAGVAATLAGDQDGIGLDAGVGVRMHLRVAGEVTPRVEVTDLTASYTSSWNPFEPGELDVAWTVTNTGNVRLGASQVLEVLAPFGLDSGVEQQLTAEQREVLPGQSVEVTGSAEAWPLGRLTVRVTSQQQVVGEDEVLAALPPATAETGVLAVPWPHLTLLCMVVLAVATLLVRRRRARARLARAVEAARAEAVSETVGA